LAELKTGERISGTEAPPVANGAAGRAPVSDIEIVQHYFDDVCERGGIPDDVREVLRTSYREIRVQIPVRFPDGRIRVYSGFRVQHNGARGPYRAGCATTPRWISTPFGRSRC
jgi:glutamate dehydrogenase (NAD(P)+)